MNNKTAIVILNYKNYQETINCINSIYTYVPKEIFSIIVVDNASGNNSLDHISSEFDSQHTVINIDTATPTDAADIILIQNNKNNGYAAGNNLGLKLGHKLGFKYLMVLNNDTLFIDDALTTLKNTLDKHNNVLCIGPLLLKGDGIGIDYNCAKRRPTFLDIFRASYFGKWLKTDGWKNEYYYVHKHKQLNHPIEVDIISGSCMLFDAAKLARIDFFEDKTFLYYEEAILHEKGKAFNYIMMLDPNARVIHLGAQSTKSTNASFVLNCEYNSLNLYLNKYRKYNKLQSGLLLLSNKLFIKAYTLLKK
jgi:GT2 family glycosyltransferase